MYNDYENKMLEAKYDAWYLRVKKIAEIKYDIDTDDFISKYNFREAFDHGLGPREFVERLAKKALDLS